MSLRPFRSLRVSKVVALCPSTLPLPSCPRLEDHSSMVHVLESFGCRPVNNIRQGLHFSCPQAKANRLIPSTVTCGVHAGEATFRGLTGFV